MAEHHVLGALRRRGMRRWWLAGVAVVAVAAVLLDLPAHAGSGYHRSQLHAYLATVQRDVAPCSDGTRDAVRAYVRWSERIPGATRSVTSIFIRQAIAVCGFADAGVVNLGSTAPPRSVASPTVDRVGPQVDAWAYLDAFTTLQDLRDVVRSPASSPARSAFQAELVALGSRRARVERLVETAERAEGMRPTPMTLIAVRRELPHGALPAPPGAA